MKNKLISVLCMCALLVFTALPGLIINSEILSANATYNIKQTIILDAGHGGEDGGAVAADGSYEKNYNLDITLKLAAILKLYGFNVILTRENDVMTCDENLETQRQKKVSDIKNREKLIKEHPEAIFISIHQNNFYDKTQKGTQVFYSHNNSDSKILAEKIQKSAVQKLQPDNKRSVKESGTEIYLLYHSQVPSVLVECGFLSNTDDLKLLNDDSYRRKLAICIADGLLKYLAQR